MNPDGHSRDSTSDPLSAPVSVHCSPWLFVHPQSGRSKDSKITVLTGRFRPITVVQMTNVEVTQANLPESIAAVQMRADQMVGLKRTSKSRHRLKDKIDT